MLVVYSSHEEVFVVESAHERTFIQEYFARGTGRNKEDFNREESDEGVVQVESRLRVRV